ncbi:MAG TPA: ABC transporter ATP-binding protein, partial [Clostridiales bacterium]|nr:ABC transporter ATP-binding protein [Clostridiales bacterium]
NYYRFCINYTKKSRAPMVYFQVTVNSTFAFLIALALILSHGGTVAPDILLNFIFYVLFTPMIATSFTKIMFMGEERMTVEDAIKRFDMILSVKPLPEPETPEKPQDASVDFTDVTFRYKEDAAPAVSHLSFSIPAGQTVAFVGPSGSGKSTIAGLVSRFWDVESGSVRIGKQNVKKISKEDRVGTVSYVFQDSKLLKQSIADNVRLAKPEATEEEILSALHLAQCDDILEKLPDGMHTVLGTKGTYLSGGEQQRIAIARAILQDAPILVLDEATAFADPENEVLVQKAFETLAKDKTVIMIAHRLTTIQNADCIFVMKKGKIAESGSHEALLQKQGLYQQMWKDYKSAVAWKVGESK